jgi:D-arabinose 1-dehydrogenase-like Zn-dependent alcohol dehydrogenase
VRAVRYSAFGVLPELATVPEPDCPAAGIVVKVVATGLCRSDWHGWMGHDPDIALPHVPGHEFAGVVSAVGSAVRNCRVGDRITAPFVCACGNCATCLRGDFQVCERQTQPGFTQWGSFAEFVAVDNADVNVVALPDSLDFGTAASLGCRFATAYRAVVHRAAVAPGEWLAVHGCGGVGLAAVMIAVAQGNRVVAVDTSAAARELARAFGASAVLDPADGSVVAAIRELTGGGAAASLDALGSPSTFGDSVRCLRPRGTHVQVGLAAGIGAVPESIVAAVIAGELQLVGSHGMAARDYPELLARIAAGELDPARLVRRMIGLKQAPAELATMGSRPGAGITVIEISA